MPEKPPGALGIDALTREVRRLKEETVRSQQALSVTMETRLWAIEAGLCRLDERLERIEREMSEQIQQLDESVGGVEGAVANLVNTVTTEIGQVQAELERLRGQTNPDLSGPITRLGNVKDTVNSAAQTLSELMPDEEPQPVPAPAGRRK